jgi:hypothetical protein
LADVLTKSNSTVADGNTSFFTDGKQVNRADQVTPFLPVQPLTKRSVMTSDTAARLTDGDLSRRLFWPALAMFSLAKAWLSWGRYLNQDEFETLHQAWLIFYGAVPYRDFRSNHPPLAFEWLSGLYHLTSDPVTVILSARLITLMTAGIVLALLYRISRDVFGSAAARWTLIIYAVNATFWEWSTEIRTDFLLVPLWLASVSLLVSPRPIRPAVRLSAIGLLMGTAFWVNQKAVFHAMPIGVLMLLKGPQRTWRCSDITWAVVASLLPAAWVMGWAWWNHSLLDLLDHNFLGSCAWGIVETNYYRAWRTVTLQRAVRFDAGFVLLALIAGIWVVRRERTVSQRFIGASAIWMFLTLFLTPGPLAYYLTSVFPLFAVAIGGLLAAALDNPSSPGILTGLRWRTVATVAAVACYLVFPLSRMSKFVRPTNRYQLDVLRVANQWFAPQTRVFDGAGTLLTRPDAYPFHWVLWRPELAAYAAGHLPPLVPTLRRNGCRLVIDTYRVRALPTDDRRLLQTQFVRLWGPLNVPGYDSIDDVGQEPRAFELWYDGLYKANRPDVLVDGQPMGSARQLSAGRHEMSLPAARARVQLRPLGVGPDSLPADTEDTSEFLGKYGYRY